ncbi:MAG: hypothetical protein V7603_3306 [Micromonosporaceae bacterium]
MATSVRAFGWAGLLAIAVGAMLSWRPLLLCALVLAALFVWGLWTAERLNYTLFAVLFLVPVTVDPGYPASPVWTVLLTATAIALLGRLQRFHPDAPVVSAGMIAFVLPAACLVAGLVRWSGPQALLVSLLPFVCYALITWHLVAEASRDPAVPERLARAFSWVGVPVALLAIYQRATGTWPVLDALATTIAFTSGAGSGRSVGTMGHPIVYGTFCMMTMCVALGLRGRLWPVPFAAGAVGAVLSGSRSAWIGTVAVLVLWYLAHRPKLTRRGVYLLVAFLVAGGGLAAFGPRPVRATIGFVGARLSNLTGSSSATARYRRTAAALSGIRESVASVLVGRGPEAHVRFFQQVGISDRLAQTFDNSYLTLWYDFGLVALLIFVLLLAGVFVSLRSLTARMLIVGFAVQIWFFDFYLWPCAAATLILAVGLAVGGRVRNGGRA